ncbi:MAG: cytochrome c nitrite reductase small subunit [Planctomycetota bacterium]
MRRRRKAAVVAGSFLAFAASVLAGSAGGLGVFTFGYARGTSYLGNDPAACANCHVMQGHLDAWVKSSHGKVATCNDCHAPHDTVGKYYCKARNGFFHSLAFTTGDYPENLTIHEYNRGVVEAACRDCHAQISHTIDVGVTADPQEPLSCIRCHADVGHPGP